MWGLYSFTEAMIYVGTGMYFAFLYNYLASNEPFAKYMPGGLGKYYAIRKVPFGTTSFDDIIGHVNVKDELNTMIRGVGVRGVVLSGEPGCGKTMFGRALCNHLLTALPSVTFVELYMDMIYGDDVPRVVKMLMHKYGRTGLVIFMDECRPIFDTFTPFLLRTMDGLDQTSVNTMFVCTTNRDVQRLDTKALTRSGRFRQYLFSTPTAAERRAYLQRYHPTCSSIDRIVDASDGLSYTDLNVLAQAPSGHDATQLSIKLRAGFQSGTGLTDAALRERTAYHELGHTLAALHFKHAPPVASVTLRGAVGLIGATTLALDKYGSTTSGAVYTFHQLLAMIVVLSAGAHFEREFTGESSTMCRDDQEKIDQLFTLMIESRMIGQEEKRNVRQLVGHALARFLPGEGGGVMVYELHDALLHRETLTADEILEIVPDFPVQQGCMKDLVAIFLKS